MILRIVFSQIFLKQMERKPQVFLFLRLFPFLAYSLSVLLLDTEYILFLDDDSLIIIPVGFL